MTRKISLVAVCCSRDSEAHWWFRDLRSVANLNQSGVLDRDHGLVGEGLEKSDLTFGERLNQEAAQVYHPNRFPFRTKAGIAKYAPRWARSGCTVGAKSDPLRPGCRGCARFRVK